MKLLKFSNLEGSKKLENLEDSKGFKTLNPEILQSLNLEILKS